MGNLIGITNLTWLIEYYVYMSYDSLYQIIDIESPHEIWTTLKGLYGDENDWEEHHFKIESLIYLSSHETSEDFFNNVDKYSQDSVAHEDYPSYVVDEAIANDNFIYFNNKDVTHEEISSFVGDEDFATNKYIALKNIEEDFDSSSIDDVDDANLMRSQFDDAPHALSTA